MNFNIVACSIDSINYTSLETFGLSFTIIRKEKDNIVINIKNNNLNEFCGVIHIKLKYFGDDELFYFPAFMYGRNRGQAPQNVLYEFPRIREHLERPSSPWWFVRSDRLSHPVAIIYSNQNLFAFSASPYYIIKDNKKIAWTPQNNGDFYQYIGFTLSMEDKTIGYTLGYENAPWLFIQTKNVLERKPLTKKNCFALAGGESINVNLKIYNIKTENVKTVYNVIEDVYNIWHENPRNINTPKQTIKDLSAAIYQDGWVEEDRNYSTIVKLNEKTNQLEYNKVMSISWTSGLVVAVPILLSGLRLKDENLRLQGLKCIENIINNAIDNKTGLFFESYSNGKWSIKGWWYDGMYNGGHSSYLIGQAIYYILRAYDYELKIKNIRHDNWLNVCTNMLKQLNKTKNSDNEYPFILSAESGAGIEYDSLASIWCLVAQAYICKLTNNKSCLNDLCASQNHYYKKFVEKVECYGAPLDTAKAVDSEGVLAFCKSAKIIHQLTGDKIYLEQLKDGLSYEYSFKFCYNSPIKIPPLSNIGWSSCGGSVTSTANPHIHPMSSNIIGEMVYYLSQQNDTYIKNRLNDTIYWSCQTYNLYDKQYDYGKKGWMSERFCHCEGLVVEKYTDGSPASTWFALMPWAGGSILDGLAGEYWDNNIR